MITKLRMGNECTLPASQIDGLGGVPKQYRWHCPMQQVQGYSRSHWTLALGNYLLCIAPMANKQQSTNWPKKMAVSMTMAIRQYIVAHITQWTWRSRASLEATGHHHWASIMPDNILRTWLQCFFYSESVIHLTRGGVYFPMSSPFFLFTYACTKKFNFVAHHHFCSSCFLRWHHFSLFVSHGGSC